MSGAPWQEEVAELFEQAARALRAKADRRAVSAFGTAIAYLEIASSNGDKLAGEFLMQVAASQKEGPTARFVFQPGELEALSVRHAGSARERETLAEKTRSGRRKKKR
jgi:hypothetical protein